MKKIEKSLTMTKKLRGIFKPLDFSTSILSENIKKLKGSFGELFFEKTSHRAENILKGVPFGPVEFLRLCKNTTS